MGMDRLNRLWSQDLTDNFSCLFHLLTTEVTSGQLYVAFLATCKHKQILRLSRNNTAVFRVVPTALSLSPRHIGADPGDRVGGANDRDSTSPQLIYNLRASPNALNLITRPPPLHKPLDTALF